MIHEELLTGMSSTKKDHNVTLNVELLVTSSKKFGVRKPTSYQQERMISGTWTLSTVIASRANSLMNRIS